jgi:hypothetical protein
MQAWEVAWSGGPPGRKPGKTGLALRVEGGRVARSSVSGQERADGNQLDRPRVEAGYAERFCPALFGGIET